jgi:hypothetical protein
MDGGEVDETFKRCALGCAHCENKHFHKRSAVWKECHHRRRERKHTEVVSSVRHEQQRPSSFIQRGDLHSDYMDANMVHFPCQFSADNVTILSPIALLCFSAPQFTVRVYLKACKERCCDQIHFVSLQWFSISEIVIQRSFTAQLYLWFENCHSHSVRNFKVISWISRWL